MSDAAKHVAMIGKLHEQHFGTEEAQKLAKTLAEEKIRAQADMAYQFANLHMPEDIRSRAKAWGMEAFCEVLWNTGFQAGFRQAQRDDATIRGDGE